MTSYGRTLAFLLCVGCQAPQPPSPPASIAIPPPSAEAPPAASSAALGPPCLPATWVAVDAVKREDVDFGITRPDAAAFAGASPALRAACMRIESASKQRLSAEFRSGPGPFGTEERKAIRASTTMGCYAGARGAWIIELGIFHREANGVGDEATWQLVYLTPEAKRVTGPDVRGRQWEADGEGRMGTSIDGVFDVDGDGVDEVAVRETGYASIDGFHDSGPILYRVQAGAVVAWDPVPGRKVWGTADVDHDGRVDFVLTNGSSRLELAHALLGGRYSTTDAVAQSFFHAECLLPLPPPSPMAPLALPMASASQEVPVEQRCVGVTAEDGCASPATHP